MHAPIPMASVSADNKLHVLMRASLESCQG